MTRRLAAIMITDVVGYSRLSHVDEEGTRRRFQADLRELFEPAIARYRGRLVKTMGDGLLIEFPSVVEAVRCAVDVQRAKAERNAQVPADRRLVHRIGINLGDVLVEDDDIQGEGVNIAARLESLAEPGGVTISGTAYDQVDKRLNLGFAFQGEQTVKNIATPIRVYRVLASPESAGKTINAVPRWSRPWRLPAVAAGTLVVVAAATLGWFRPWQDPPASGTPNAASIAVLPFENLSDDAEQGYLADGITDDTTTDLARVPGLFVASRHAANRYKGQSVTPAQVAADLHVRYLLEGSVRRTGDMLRINAQLIDTTTGGHLWAEHFDGAWADVFTVQDRVVAMVGDALELRLRVADLSAPGGTAVPAAYEAYLRGIERYDRFWNASPVELAKAAAFFEEATTLDPDYGQAYAALAEIHLQAWTDRQDVLGKSRDAMLPEVVSLLRKAMEHPSPRSYRVTAQLRLRQREYIAAIDDFERAIALDPSDPASHSGMAWAMLFAGRLEDAQRFQAAAVELDPRYADYGCDVEGLIRFTQEQFGQAAATWGDCVAEYPSDLSTRLLLIAAMGRDGLNADASTQRAKADEAVTAGGRPPFSILSAYADFPLQQPADAERLREGFRQAGVPELPFGYDLASLARLTRDEVEKLLFGHTARAQNLDSGEACVWKHAADGAPVADCGKVTDTGAVPTFDGDVACYWWTNTGPSCVAYFRNPDATPADRNEYLAVTPSDRWEFSISE
ncbi:MAG: adenylate/guanylate cyclase domain-containing protein [Geminicoccaceae bacterium]